MAAAGTAASIVAPMLRLCSLLLLLCPAFAARAQTVVCFGDSLTSGYGGDPGRAYPDFLRTDLLTDGYHATIVNQGLGGDTSEGGLTRLPAVLAAHPAIVVLELGANDGLRRLPPPTVERNLGLVIAKMQQAHIRVVLAGIVLPRLPNGTSEAYIAEYNRVFPALAARYQIPLIPWLLDGVYGNFPLMSNDYLHPNSRGYEHVAQTVLPYVEALLKQ